MGNTGGFFSLPPEVMTALGVVAGYALAGDLTTDQMDALGDFLMLMGQVLETLAAQKTQLRGQARDGEITALWHAVHQLQRRLEE